MCGDSNYATYYRTEKQGVSFTPLETFAASPTMRPIHVFKTADFILAGGNAIHLAASHN